MISDRPNITAKKRQNLDSTFNVNPFQSRGFVVQAKSEDSVPATKAQLWESYQQAKQLNQSGANSVSVPIQTKLTIGQPGDKYEQEADSVADRVMAMPEPAQVQREELPEEEEEELQMKPEDNVVQLEELPEAEEELQIESLDNSIQREELPEEEKLQMKQSTPSTQTATPDLESQLSSSKGGGSPLSDDVQSFMEPRFGSDFSRVRVHTGSDAVQMNQGVNAQAFAHGSDIYFGAGKAPGKDALTAHELTHVVQQGGGIQRSLGRNVQIAPIQVQRNNTASHPTILIGSTGATVTELQEKLNDRGATPPLKIDGIFGPKTRAAVVTFQTNHPGINGKPLRQDGVVGKRTWGAIDSGASNNSPTPTPPEPTPPATISVIIPPAIRNGSTPASMAANRIPPRIDTAINVSMSGTPSSSAPVVLSIEGAGGSNGSATINGNPTFNLTGSSTVQLRGGNQTNAGSGGNLKLVAKQAGVQIASSLGFSVSAIPQNYSETFDSLLTGDKRGFVVQDGWESDSGVVADLDSTQISEEVQPVSAGGCFTTNPSDTSSYLAGNIFTQDSHSSPTAMLTGPGSRIANQTCKFKDNRSGAVDIPMTNSGYLLTRTVTQKAPSKLEHTMFKFGANVTANGITSAAGSGVIVKSQDV
jgi:peptidoglycan hydrolase-like protein with peptidoglycan-binding domain